MTQQKIDEEQRARAALHALDALEAQEVAAFEEQIAKAPAALRKELDALRETAATLGLAAAPVAPRAHVRERLLAAVAAEADRGDAYAAQQIAGTKGKQKLDRRAVRGTPEFFFAAAKHLPWSEIYAGVEVKVLTPNAPPGQRAHLVRVAPGARVRPHDHAWVEHCFVVEGDFEVAEERLGAGDYHRAGAGTHHREVGSTGGCVFLIVEAHA